MRVGLTESRVMRALALSCLLVISSCAWSSEATGVAGDATKEFQASVQHYVTLQKKAVASVPPIGKDVTDPLLIAKHEKDVADAIRKLRPDAKQGDIFTPNARQMISAILKQKVDGLGGVDAKVTILGEGNPRSGESPAPINLAVNAPYPITAPLSTVPPSVLMALPMLPKEVEFRFVGHNLILRDTQANMIADVMPNAF